MKETPLVVDLDRTYVRHDTFFHGLKLCLFSQPQALKKILPSLLCLNLAEAKFQLARSLSSFSLPLNKRFSSFLHHQKKHFSRPLWLVTGANYLYAEEAQKRSLLFQKIFASDRLNNISAGKKLTWILSRLGKNFDYAGDRLGDYKIFEQARVSFVVNPTWALTLRLFLDPLPNCVVFDVQGAKKLLLRRYLKQETKTVVFNAFQYLDLVETSASNSVGLQPADT